MERKGIGKDLERLFLDRAISAKVDEMEDRLSLNVFNKSYVKNISTAHNNAIITPKAKVFLRQNEVISTILSTALVPSINYPGSNIPKCAKVDPTTHSHAQPGRLKGTLLSEYVDNLLENDARFPDSKEEKYIINSMLDFCKDVCRLLHERYPIFRDCYYLETGSVFEGLKTNCPDEFDFMIIVPEFANSNVINFKPADEFQLLEYNIIDKSMFSLDQDGDSSFFTKIDGILEDMFLEILPENWRISADTLGRTLTTSRIAHTLKLIYDGDDYKNFAIGVDFCLSVPLKKVPFWLDYSTLAGVQVIETSKPLFYIIRDKNCRLSFSVYEKVIINQYPNDSKPKCLLRLVKVLRNKFLSKIYDPNTRLMTSWMPSYWLKTVMYQMLCECTCESCWSEINIADAVINLFQKVYDCLEAETLFSFFIPKYNLLSPFSANQYRVRHRATYLESPLKAEKLKYMDEIKNLLKILSALNKNQDVISMLVTMEEERTLSTKKEYENNLRADLLNMFYYYAYNDADDEMGFNSIKTFIKDHFPAMSISGSGYDVVLRENDEIINIDKKLAETYGTHDDGQEFNFFPLSRE
ncbi:uncharacterized protein LOC130644289 [Hydractinia symbiolongicarpus]|uniref:uncharacterized protein LOC130644289 n=1 Tax=Hydractinia symbiolongicarpus TaxID=13093 RepID=UPI00254C3D79|nr:uncharacterized protein LOC130644289 [Hydractinia symbiolongicarpus]